MIHGLQNYPYSQNTRPPQFTNYPANPWYNHPRPVNHFPPFRYPEAPTHSNIAVRMSQMTLAEMEEFQNLSDRYQADLPGPLVGEKLPMGALVTEYAQADPTFVVKTTGLAASHSSYRAVKGDGQCGWRATVFGYFEVLLNSGDSLFVQTEKIRFQSFADSMQMIGLDYDLLADMFDATWELFDRVQQAVDRGDRNIQVVLDTMNDQNASDSVVYHFKMVTSTHMQLRADQYEPFLEMTVGEYRVSRIDPTNQEIDQIGLQALTDAVISAAGINLEVLYLDRSMGEEATPHPFSQVPNSPYMIRLLYRPGHYDIIYRDGQQQQIQVYLQPQAIPHYMQDPRPVQPASSVLESLYGAGGMPMPHGSNSYDMSYNSSYQQQPKYEDYSRFAHQPMNCYPPQPYQSIPQQPPPPPPPPVAMPMTGPPQQRPQVATQYSNSSRSVTMSPSPINTSNSPNEPQIRFTSSMYNMHRHESVPLTQSPSSCTTNVNHFQHHNFDPHRYDPQNDYNG